MILISYQIRLDGSQSLGRAIMLLFGDCLNFVRIWISAIRRRYVAQVC